jgi:hypothetical protein
MPAVSAYLQLEIKPWLYLPFEYISYYTILGKTKEGKVATFTEADCFLLLNPSLSAVKIASKSLRKAPGAALEPLISL